MHNTLVMKLGNEVDIKMPSENGAYPIVIIPKNSINFFDWTNKYKDEINHTISVYGAILFRGFEIGNAQKFNELFCGLMGDALEYKNQSSPREKVFENVYTSTIYPKHQRINMHTENSYSPDYVQVIAFYCLQPPYAGGETPIAHERRLLKYMNSNIIDKFRKKKILYIRNIMTGAGLDWKTVYQTDDKAVVNQILEKDGIDYKWIADDHLRLKWILPAIQIHPITKEEMWFNHMYFYHKSQYNPEIIEYFEEQDLPFTSYYGDGSIIEDSVIQEFRNFYKENSIVFKWEKDDFLLLDNMMFSHGRNSYEGERSILTAMSQPLRFKV